MIKIDIGCGTNKKEGFLGIDKFNFDNVDYVLDVSKKELPFENDSVDEVYASHFLEHLEANERIFLINELYRVMKKGAKATIITPSWSHERAYGDPTHKFPPICSWTYFYLNKEWRKINAPHTDLNLNKSYGYDCDFDHTVVGTHDVNDDYIAYRNDQTKITMMTRNINTTTDIICTLIKK